MLPSDDDTLLAIDVPIMNERNPLSRHYSSELVAGPGSEFGVQAQRQQVVSKKSLPKKRLPKVERSSRLGIPYPSLPVGIIKKLALPFVRSSAGRVAKLNKEALASLEQASDLFFKQVGEDVITYTDHAGRKTINDTDVVILMKRSIPTRLHTSLANLEI